MVLPIMTIYCLPHGQYGYSGHVLNLPQDVASFTNNLPRSPSQLDVIIVRKEGATGSHKDFRVRRSVVLEWLIEHNIYYRSVTIDHSALAQLPTDGDLTNLPTMRVDSNEEENPAREDDDPYNTILGSTFIPLPVRSQTQQQVIQQSIAQSSSSSSSSSSLPVPISWPSSIK